MFFRNTFSKPFFGSMNRSIKPRSSVSRHEIEAIVHTFYPAIAAFFESEEGKQEYEEWKAKREERKEKKTPAERSA